MEPKTLTHIRSLYLLSYMLSPHTEDKSIRLVRRTMRSRESLGDLSSGLSRPYAWKIPERPLPYNSRPPQPELVLAGDIFPIIGNKPAKASLQNSNLTGPIGQGQGHGMSPGGGEGMISPRCGKKRARGTHLVPRGS